MTESGAHERLKFIDFEFVKKTDGHCNSRVTLERAPGERYVGASEAFGAQAGELRCAAQAATDALQNAVGDQMQFELLGVKAVRAFDALVIIVSLSCHNGMPATRLVGSCLSETDQHRCAALAVLNATNRLLGNIVFMR
jgi:hypothetical protein